MCCKGFIKTMMFIFNGVIFLAGVVLLAVGIWVSVDRMSLLGFLDNIDNAPPELAQLANIGYVLIAVGVFLALVGFLGCCGAIQESRCMLLSFFIIVLIIFIVEVAAAIFLFVFQPVAEKLLEDIGQQVSKSISDKYGADERFTGVWNNTMDEGTVGCFKALVTLVEENAILLAGVAIGIAVLEIAAMVVSMVLYKTVGK
ncbi:tetraspanin-1-like isoform X3 [Xyrauchen texanus]|uniref:tetraspanin-1-like isoform X3 n=1 Tax=Xyrauchen texanus TaxID=154827 RepID=UPI002242529C|nr:tetraspanin-1-like isoform X3 [Xyrauchen texanus]